MSEKNVSLNITVTIELETLKHLFDLATDSPMVCSGSFENADVDVLRATAAVVGVDPLSITPDEFVSNYPHPFKRRTVTAEPQRVGEYAHRLTGDIIPFSSDRSRPEGYRYRTRDETADEQRARMAQERADLTCQAGPYGRPCRRLAADPLHHGVPLPKREDDDA